MGRAKGKKLTTGSTVRIFRDGTVLIGPLLQVPDGEFTVRHLDPGSYIARDETGGEARFIVSPDREDAVVQAGSSVQTDDGVPETSTAEPGSARTFPADATLKSTDAGTPPAREKSADTPRIEPQADAHVLGEPGSAKITRELEENPIQMPGQTKAEIAKEQPTNRDVVGEVPADLEDSPAVLTAGKGDNSQVVVEPPKELKDGFANGNPAENVKVDEKRTAAPGSTDEVSHQAAAGPYAPMPDVSGDEPEDVPVDDPPGLPQGQLRDGSGSKATKSPVAGTTADGKAVKGTTKPAARKPRARKSNSSSTTRSSGGKKK